MTAMFTRSLRPAIFLLICALLVLLTAPRPADWGTDRLKTVSAADGISRRAVRPPAYGKLPLRFEPNRGQAVEQVKFLARGGGYTVFLTESAATLKLRREGAEAVIRLQWLDALPRPRMTGVSQRPGMSHYFFGSDARRWISGVENYGRVEYAGIYPGVDLVFYGNGGNLEYDFNVRAGVDPGAIKLALSGADRVQLTNQGELAMKLGASEARWRAPRAWQEIDGERREIDCRYVIKPAGRATQVSFALGAYDPAHPLTIDPILSYATFLGGLGNEAGTGVAVDSAGNVYVCGYTSSIDFPNGDGPQPLKSVGNDAFVLKLDPEGAAVYATYLGGNGTDRANSISVSAAGEALIAGETSSSDFPTTTNAPQPKPAGGIDGFIARLDASGSVLSYSTLLGGAETDRIYGVAVDAAGSAHVTGETFSTDFPVVNSKSVKAGASLYESSDGAGKWSVIRDGLTANAVQAVAFDPADSNRVYAAAAAGFYRSTDGGNQWALIGMPPLMFGISPNIRDIAIDPGSPNTIYLGTAIGVAKSVNGGQSFILKNSGFGSANINSLAIDPRTPATIYASTSIGVYKTTNGGESWRRSSDNVYQRTGNFTTATQRLAIDPVKPETVYLATTYGMFKTTNGAGTWTQINQGLPGQNFDGPAVTSLAIDPVTPSILYIGVSGASSVFYKTTDGGANWTASDAGLSVTINNKAVKQAPAVLAVSGATIYAGTAAGVFKSKDGGAMWGYAGEGLTTRAIAALAVDPKNSEKVFAGADAGSDAFIAKLNAEGAAFVYARYFGGQDTETARGVALDGAGGAWITGQTNSVDFPTAGALRGVQGNSGDAFVARFDEQGETTSSIPLGGSGLDFGAGVALDGAGDVFIAGVTQSTDFPTQSPGQTVFGGGTTDGFIAKLKADGSALVYATYFGGNDHDRINGLAVDRAGRAWVTGQTLSANFPIVNLQQPQQTAQGADAFAAKINQAGQRLIYSTLIGGVNSEEGAAIAIDLQGNAYLTGSTNSKTISSLAPLTEYRSGLDAFLVKLSPVVDLAVGINVAGQPLFYGANATATITVSNRGDLRATGVQLRAETPPGAQLISLHTPQGSCAGAAVITCDLGRLEADATIPITVVFTPPPAASVRLTATVSGAEPDVSLANNTASTTAPVNLTDLTLNVIASHRRIEPGEKLTWLLQIRNDGPARAGNITLTDALPPETTFISCEVAGAGACSGEGNNRVATITALGANETATVVIAATVNRDAAVGKTIVNNAALTPLASDPNQANDRTTAVTTVVAPPTPERKNGRIAFARARFSDTPIVVIEPDGSRRFTLTTGTQPAWSPDGTTLAFVLNDLFLIRGDGANLQRLAAGGESPSWSPDGTKLAIVRSGAVVIVNADGSGEQSVPNSATSYVRWSPDGAKLLLMGNEFSTCNIDGSGRKRLSDITSNIRLEADWSPDGKQIVFRRGSTGVDIFIVNADGTGLKQLTRDGEYKMSPVWSPDGSKIAYLSSSSAAGVRIIVITSDGTGAQTILSGLSVSDPPTLAWQRLPAVQPRTLILSGRIEPTGEFNPQSVTVELSGTRSATVSVSPGAVFTFGNLPAGGDYSISLRTSNYKFEPSVRTYANLQADVSDANFRVTYQPMTISGRITDPAGEGLANVPIRLFGPDRFTETDQNGYYSFTNLTRGVDVRVQPDSMASISTTTYEPASVQFINPTGDRTANFVGVREPFTLRGRVRDANGSSMRDVTVTLSGPRTGVAVTNSSGDYSFPGLPIGYAYTLSAAKAGVTFAPASRTVTPARGMAVNFYAGATTASAVSAASFTGPLLAPNSIVALFGSGLATTTRVSPQPVLELDGIRVSVVSKNDVNASCQIFFVSPGQINIQLADPVFSSISALSQGDAVILVTRNNNVIAAAPVQLARVAPAIFTADSSGRGLAAAQALRVKADGSQVYEPIARYDEGMKQFVPIPIDLGSESETVFLVLYGSGWRARSELPAVKLQIGGVDAPVSFAGAVPNQVGLDQINAPIPRALIGRGEVEVLLTVEGKAAKPVRISVK